MRRLLIIVGLFILLCLPAGAQSFGFAAGQRGPGWWGPGAGSGSQLWGHERRERRRLLQHQLRERRLCRLYGRDCGRLAGHQRREWRRLQRHQGVERWRFRPW